MAQIRKNKYSTQERSSFLEGRNVGKHLKKQQPNKVDEIIRGYELMIRRELDKVDKTNISYAKGALSALRKKRK